MTKWCPQEHRHLMVLTNEGRTFLPYTICCDSAEVLFQRPPRYEAPESDAVGASFSMIRQARSDLKRPCCLQTFQQTQQAQSLYSLQISVLLWWKIIPLYRISC